jgi:hypothetical protein
MHGRDEKYMVIRGSFPGVKRPAREADRSPQSSAMVKNVWSYTSTLPICFHGVVLNKSTGITLPLPLHNILVGKLEGKR